jgi:transcriptional regulator with XRE-family HTH domain
MSEYDFGKVLQEIRKERKISQEKLAELCELDRTYISLLERNLRQPTISTFFKLAKALNVSSKDFIDKIEKSIL